MERSSGVERARIWKTAQLCNSRLYQPFGAEPGLDYPDRNSLIELGMIIGGIAVVMKRDQVPFQVEAG